MQCIYFVWISIIGDVCVKSLIALVQDIRVLDAFLYACVCISVLLFFNWPKYFITNSSWYIYIYIWYLYIYIIQCTEKHINHE